MTKEIINIEAATMHLLLGHTMTRSAICNRSSAGEGGFVVLVHGIDKKGQQIKALITVAKRIIQIDGGNTLADTGTSIRKALEQTGIGNVPSVVTSGEIITANDFSFIGHI